MNRDSDVLGFIGPEWEPSAWLRGEFDEVLRHPVTRVAMRRGVALVTGLRRGERTCDRCGKDVPVGQIFWTFTYQAAAGVAVIVGLCDEHGRAEGLHRFLAEPVAGASFHRAGGAR